MRIDLVNGYEVRSIDASEVAEGQGSVVDDGD